MSKSDLGHPCDHCQSLAVIAVCGPEERAAYYCTKHEPLEIPEGFASIRAEQLPAGAGRLLFRAEDVEHLLSFRRELSWAKDTGTYLAAWGDAGLVASAPAYTTDGLCLDDSVTYEQDSALFDAIRETTRDICGGDDFLEVGIELPPRPTDAQWLVFDVNEEAITVSWA